MLKSDEVLQRVCGSPGYEKWTPDMFMLQVIPNNYSLAAVSGGVFGSVSQQAMQFPAGAVIIGMTGGASIVGADAATLTRPGNDLYTVGINYQQQRWVVGTGQASANSLFGPFNDLFPAKEIIVPQNGSLLISLTSLVTVALNVWITAHCLVPNMVQ